MSTMHAATLENSDRLRRVSRLLSDGREYTTLDIMLKGKVCAVNSIISELRRNGQDIRCVRRGNTWYYRRVFDQKESAA